MPIAGSIDLQTCNSQRSSRRADHSAHEPSRPLRPDARRHLAWPVLPARLAAAGRRARATRALIGAIGASDLLQLDGVGGGSTLTSKVAIVSRSSEPGCDVDYLFAQVGVGQRSVDTRPNCGNMLVGRRRRSPSSRAWSTAQDGETTVRVFNVNTRSRIDVTVQTPGRRVTYDGERRIDGVAGTAAPIRLNFLDAWGAVTGSVFPTGGASTRSTASRSPASTRPCR